MPELWVLPCDACPPEWRGVDGLPAFVTHYVMRVVETERLASGQYLPTAEQRHEVTLCLGHRHLMSAFETYGHPTTGTEWTFRPL